MTSCRRLIGKEGENCQNCGRLIVRYDTRSVKGGYWLEHEGPTVAQRLQALEQKRRGL
jgi:hypothetical protein